MPEIAFGWKRDFHDPRDLAYGAPGPGAVAALPPRVMKARECLAPVPIENQSTSNACVGFAVTAAMEYIDCCRDGRPHTDLSQMFLWYEARRMQGWQGQNTGCQIRDAVAVAAHSGCCTHGLMPFSVSKYAVAPTARQRANAAEHQATEYRRINVGSNGTNTGINGIKAALAEGLPVVFGFTVFPFIDTAKAKRTGFIRLPSRREVNVGGHAVLAVGYDDTRPYVRPADFPGNKDVQYGMVCFRNSWGRAWGDEGHGWLPYDYFRFWNLSADYWTITGMERAA